MPWFVKQAELDAITAARDNALTELVALRTATEKGVAQAVADAREEVKAISAAHTSAMREVEMWKKKAAAAQTATDESEENLKDAVRRHADAIGALKDVHAAKEKETQRQIDELTTQFQTLVERLKVEREQAAADRTAAHKAALEHATTLTAHAELLAAHTTLRKAHDDAKADAAAARTQADAEIAAVRDMLTRVRTQQIQGG